MIASLRAAMSTTPKKRSSLAMCIIADEVLNGKTIDTNSQYVSRKAFSIGLDLQEIRVIKDDDAIIQKTVLDLSQSHDIVFTSGGIGPTHDDLTYESISRAFNKPMIFHEPTAERMKLKNGTGELNAGQRRMCTFPEPSEEVLVTEGLWQPIVRVENVFILPGVPSLFTRMFDTWIAKNLGCYKVSPMKRIGIRTTIKESVISKSLGDYHERLRAVGWTIGSYPKLNADTGESWVEISLVGPTLEGSQTDCLQTVLKEMKQTYNATDMLVD